MIRNGLCLAAIIFLLVCAFGACTQQRSPCYEPKIVSAVIGTYRIVDTSSIDSLLPQPAFTCLDTPLSQEIAANNIFTPLLSPHADSTRWLLIPDRFNPDDSADVATPVEFYDTLTFYHTKELNFISNACGYVYYYTLTNVTTTYHSIDSISLLNNTVDNNANTQHIRIYY
jgi:hypothetical protein